MIANQWYVVLESSQVRDKPVGVTRMGEKLVFWRDRQGSVHCLRDRCAHRGAQLSAGTVAPSGHLQCPFHGLEYDPSGRVTVIPANSRVAPVPERFRVDGYLAHEEHGFVWIWWGDGPPSNLAAPRFFDDIGEGFSCSGMREVWDTHYSRAVENQLDVSHVPIVHYNTIGRGGRTVIDGPAVEWVGDSAFNVYVYGRVDDGTPPKRPDEVPVPHPSGFRLEFIFPNLWQNHISDSVCIVAAFVPIDDAHTMIYLRFYQRFIRVPVLRDIVNRGAMLFNRRVLHQDRRVVLTQRPLRSALRTDEKLFQADRPIIEYRRRRQALIETEGADQPSTGGA